MNINKKILGLLLLMSAFLQSLNVFGQDIKARVHIDSTRVLIGDYIKAQITIEGVPATATDVSETVAQQFEQKTIELISADTFEKNAANNTWTQTIIASAYADGQFYFPSLKYAFKLEDGTIAQLVPTDSIKIQVQTIQVDTTQDIRPIQDIILVNKTTWEKILDFLIATKWLWISIIALAVIVILLIIYKKKQKNKVVAPVAIPLTMEQKYLQLINGVRAKNYIASADFKMYYSELSDILRAYIDERFDIPAPELTTQEVLKLAKRTPKIKNYKPMLKELLQLSDLVKFAKVNPTEEQATRDIETIIEFIKSTKIQEAKI